MFLSRRLVRNPNCRHRHSATFARLLSSSKTTKPPPTKTLSQRQSIALVSVSLATGYAVGRLSTNNNDQSPSPRVLPSGLPRTCCDDATPLSQQQLELISALEKIVGKSNITTSNPAKYTKGMRLGSGKALCVVTPTCLEDFVKCIQPIVEADCTILVQGANTGLTGGSVPRNNSERPTVLISTQHLDTIFPIDDGERVVCLAGAGLASLAQFLSQNFPNRESHSTLGSTFLNPTTAAGVALGSGGTQCRKGSAYTDRALYVTITKNKWGELEVNVVNTLGIAGIEDEDFYTEGRYQTGNVVQQLDHYCRDVQQGYQRSMAKSSSSKHGKAMASDVGYAERLVQCDDSVSRYNADTRGCDCNRSEGKVIILATVHDTFPKPLSTKSFWVSFDSLETALKFQRQVCLVEADDIPVSLEYMDHDAFSVIDESGRVLSNLIWLVGPSSSIVKSLWGVKQWIEGLPFSSAPYICDKVLYAINNWVPSPLPSPIMKLGSDRSHHIAMTVGEFGDGNMNRLLDRMQEFASENGKEKIEIYDCASPSEAASLTAFRFVAAPAFKTWCIGEGLQGFSVDYALPKNGGAAPPISSKPVKRMRYSHFGCNVVHEDLAYPLDVDAMKAKMDLKHTVEHTCHGKLPAEHGHGTEYTAPPETQARWKRVDPLNVLNVGIGGLSSEPNYKEGEEQ